MSQIKTVKIHGGPGEPESIIINAEDFDAETMTLFEEVPAQPAVGSPQSAESEPSAEDLMKHTKAGLVAIAEEKGLTLIPDEMTKAQIVDAINTADENGKAAE